MAEGAAKYRRKPLVVDAIRVTDALKLARSKRREDLPGWLRDAYQNGELYFLDSRTFGEPGIELHTYSGWVTAREGEWVVRGAGGDIYPCRGDVFELNYEAVG